MKIYRQSHNLYWEVLQHTHDHRSDYISLQKYRLTWTQYSCIWIRAGSTKKWNGLAALSQVLLSPCTPHIAVPGWTTASSTCCIRWCSYCSQISQLTTHNCSITKVPVAVAYSTPLSKVVHLNTSFCCNAPSYQSDSAYRNCVIFTICTIETVELAVKQS